MCHLQWFYITINAPVTNFQQVSNSQNAFLNRQVSSISFSKDSALLQNEVQMTEML